MYLGVYFIFRLVKTCELYICAHAVHIGRDNYFSLLNFKKWYLKQQLVKYGSLVKTCELYIFAHSVHIGRDNYFSLLLNLIKND